MLSLFLTFCFITWLQLEATKKKLYVDVGMIEKLYFGMQAMEFLKKVQSMEFMTKFGIDRFLGRFSP